MEIFNENLIEKSFKQNLIQIEGLFIKSFKIILRKYNLLLFILIIPIIIEFYLINNKSMNKLIINLNDCSHLNYNKIFIGIDNNKKINKKEFYSIKYYLEKKFPLTNIFYLNNITNIQQLNYFYWSNFILVYIFIFYFFFI